jgi:hypothetical protein
MNPDPKHCFAGGRYTYHGGGLNPDGGIPLARWEDGHGVQELVQACQQVVPLLRLVRHVVEHLVRHDRRHGSSDLMVTVDTALNILKHNDDIKIRLSSFTHCRDPSWQFFLLIATTSNKI